MNALQRQVTKGTTGISVVLRAVAAATSFSPSTSVNSGATAGLVVKYYRLNDGVAVDGGTSVALVSNGVGGGLSFGFSAGMMIPIADGYVRLDVPDAAFAKAVGVNGVLVTATATNITFYGALVQLVDGSSGGALGDTPRVY